MLRTHEIFEKVVEFVHTEQNLRIIFNTLEGSYSLCLLANLVHLAYEERDAALPKLAFPKFNVSFFFFFHGSLYLSDSKKLMTFFVKQSLKSTSASC